MALVATVGAKTANSYVTVAEADTYFGDHPLTATWTAQTTAQKEQYLIQATRDIDNETLAGVKYDTDIDASDGLPDQALHFPRSQDITSSAVKYIPILVKKACYEQAIDLARAGVSATRLTLQAQGVTSATIGDVSETYGSRASASQLRIQAKALLMSGGFIELSGAYAT